MLLFFLWACAEAPPASRGTPEPSDAPDSPAPCSLFFADADGDGWGNELDSACELGPTPPHPVDQAGDCDDQESRSNPGAAELCGDWDDNDCDDLTDEDGASDCIPLWADADGDTFGAGERACGCPASGRTSQPGDCDDDDVGVNPAAVPVCNDRLDNACDGGTTCRLTRLELPEGADRMVNGVDYGGRLGSALAACDLDGDGADEVIGGAPEAGSLSRLDGTRAVDWPVPTSWPTHDGNLGYAVGSHAAAIDGEPNAGRVAIRGNGPVATGSLADFPGFVRGVVASTYAGKGLAGPGDVNGDGFDDLLVGGYDGAWVFLGGTMPQATLDEADAASHPVAAARARWNSPPSGITVWPMTPVPTLDRITVTPTILGGKPCVRGMRLSVERVLAILAENPSWTDLQQDYPELEVEDVRQVLAFAAGLVAGRIRMPTASAA